jgi:hypothetical protein
MKATETAGTAGTIRAEAARGDTCRWVKRPAAGVVGVLAINGTEYNVVPMADEATSCTREGQVPALWVLWNQANGKMYRVPNALVPTCTCPDYEHRRARAGEECKHIRALRAALRQL